MNTVPMTIARIPSAHPLRVPAFRSLWIGSTISLFGDQFYLIALPWLILQITGSAVALGSILMVAAIPRAVFVLFGGVASDRFSLTSILISTAVGRMLLVAVTAALVQAHLIHLWHLYVLALAFGVADAFAAPATQALLPLLVMEEQFPAANGIASGTSQLVSIIGPAPAGLVLKVCGIASAFAIDAFSFLFMIAVLSRIPKLRPPLAMERSQGLWTKMLEGLRYVAKHPAMRSLLFLTATLNLCAIGPLAVGLAFLARQRLGSATAFGSMLSALALGVLLGSLLPAVIPSPRRKGLYLLIICAALGVEMIGIGLFSHVLPILILLVLVGFGNGLAVVYLQSWFQANVERDFLGRVMGVLLFAVYGLVPISYAVAGLLVRIDLEIMFVSSGLLILSVTTITALCGPARHIE